MWWGKVWALIDFLDGKFWLNFNALGVRAKVSVEKKYSVCISNFGSKTGHREGIMLSGSSGRTGGVGRSGVGRGTNEAMWNCREE